ncbi:MAG: rane protein insertion efficiency factor YidD [Actinomycetota bacterium]
MCNPVGGVIVNSHLWLLPRNLFVAFILGWRKLISPLYGDVCRYHPSCSAYGLGVVQQFGLVRGSALAAWRILRCNPWSRGGIDDVPARMDGNFPLSRSGFVLPKKKEH